MRKEIDVSIITAVKNESDFIGDSIKSVQRQDEQNWEHLIVDDNSDDDTANIARGLIDNRGLVLRSPGNGKVAAFNYGFIKSRGKYIALLGGDDELPPNSLSKRLSACAGSDPLRTRLAVLGHYRSYSKEARYDGLIVPKHTRGIFSGGCVMVSRKLAQDVFQVPVDLPNEDSWLRLCIEHFADEVRSSPGIVYFYRIHSRNSTAARNGFEKAERSYRSRAAVYDRFLEHFAHRLSKDSVEQVSAQALLERRRQSAGVWKMICTANVPILDRVRAACYARPALYRIRLLLWRFTTGWR